MGEHQVKYVFVTGGVVSSLGKGVTTAALGRLLVARGLRVAFLKLDPYLNVDAGTMSPYQHGEVFVTDDGAETDLDLGHYERFTGVLTNRLSNVTAGQVYGAVVARERRGDYLGATVQVIPQVTDEIKARIVRVAKDSNSDVVLVEVGGTVGDIESLPFLEAIRQMRKDAGRDNVLYLHVTLLPRLPGGELKTKPTQHSVRELRAIGIAPDVIVLRSDTAVLQEIRDKIALFCDVEPEAVVPALTLPSIYEVPLALEAAGLGSLVVLGLGLGERVSAPDLAAWAGLVERISAPKPVLELALVGKYIALPDAYFSVTEALRHASVAAGLELHLRWVNADLLSSADGAGVAQALGGVAGILVPGGFGHRGIEGKVVAARYARERGVPYLGLCLGLQCAVIEVARNLAGLTEANSTEFNAATPYPVIDLLPDQREREGLGGSMRLGLAPTRLLAGSRARAAYDGAEIIYERHRHRYEVNPAYRAALVEAGLVISGSSPDGQLVEVVELAEHPFYLATQFHPEFKSRPDAPHPLFAAFLGAAGAASKS